MRNPEILTAAAHLLNSLSLSAAKPEGHSLAAHLLTLAASSPQPRMTVSQTRYHSREVQTRIETEGAFYTVNFMLAPGQDATQPSPIVTVFPNGPGPTPNAWVQAFDFRPADVVLLESVKCANASTRAAVDDLTARVKLALAKAALR